MAEQLLQIYYYTFHSGQRMILYFKSQGLQLLVFLSLLLLLAFSQIQYHLPCFFILTTELITLVVDYLHSVVVLHLPVHKTALQKGSVLSAKIRLLQKA